MSKEKSKCCGADVSIEGKDGTNYYVCAKCNSPCDVQHVPQPDEIEKLAKIIRGIKHRPCVKCEFDGKGCTVEPSCHCKGDAKRMASVIINAGYRLPVRHEPLSDKKLRKSFAKVIFCYQNCAIVPSLCRRARCKATDIFKQDYEDGNSNVNMQVNALLAVLAQAAADKANKEHEEKQDA